jgi:hypothetical protein
MRRALFIDFADPQGLRAGIEAARLYDVELVDAFTPFPVEGLGEIFGGSEGARRVRIAMLVGGLALAGLAYGLEYYSATIAYPFDAGGRAHNSWPAFMLFPFEFGVLAAAVCGLVGLFAWAGLPRLNHPVFEVEGFERASNDRFILVLATPATKQKRKRLEEKLAKGGALLIREGEL